MGTEAKRKRDVDLKRKRAAARREEGLCVDCGALPPCPDSTIRCQGCLGKRRACEKKAYHRQQAEGRCRCGVGRIPPGKHKCPACQERLRKYFRNWKKERRQCRTPVVTTRQAMYAAICADPDDDTLRLAFADWLEEQGAVRVPCPKCMGTGSHGLNPYELAQRYGTHRAGLILDASRCGICDGTGTVLDTADADRAEFIRVQVAAASRPVCPSCLGIGQVRCVCAESGFPRELALYRAHPEWQKCPCPDCKGLPPEFPVQRGEGTFRACALCTHTGDLLAGRRVTFDRGFPDGVECVAADVWRDGPCSKCHQQSGWYSQCDLCNDTGRVTVPTAWAKAVVRQTPVTRFVVTDRRPNMTEYGLAWHRGGSHHASTDGVPEKVFDAMKLRQVGDYKTANTHEEARDALALAVGRWVRSFK